MEIGIDRKWFTSRSTIGELSIDGDFECFTLEDRVVDGTRIEGKGAIPPGRYRVVVTVSDRARRGALWSPSSEHLLPLLLDVPSFDGIRIHAGNTDKDTEGCILVGRGRQPDAISNSRAALSALLPKIEEALATEDAYITIVNVPGAIV